MVFGSFLYRENKNLPFFKLFVNAATSILSSASSIESLQLSLSDRGLNLLLEVIAISRVMAMVAVETAILILGTFVGVTLQLSRERQSLFVLDLHKDLIYRGC